MSEPDALVRLPEVERQTSYRRSRLYDLIKEDKFPAPVRLAGGGAVAWRQSEVKAWIDAQPRAVFGKPGKRAIA